MERRGERVTILAALVKSPLVEAGSPTILKEVAVDEVALETEEVESSA